MEDVFKAVKQLRYFLKAIKPGIGPSPKFTPSHVLMCLYIISEKQPIGRKKLSAELGIGEGSARSLLAKLKNAGLLEISKKGLRLSEQGEEFLKRLKIIMSPPKRVDVRSIAVGRSSVAILVRGAANKVSNGMRVRDAAVKLGAAGATTLVFVEGKLRIPGVSQNVKIDYPEEAGLLFDELRPKEGDVIILGTAERLRDAGLGAIAGALSLLNLSW